MVHQFDDRMYVRCLQHQPAHQQQPQQHTGTQHRHQLLTSSNQYTAGPAATSASTAVSDYVMYTGSGNAAGGDDVTASVCRRHHDVMSYVTDITGPTNPHRQPSSLQQQQHVYYTDYQRHQLDSECVVPGSVEDGQTGPVTVCWTYPSTTGETDICEDSSTTAGWPVSVRAQYGGCMRADDPLDLLHHHHDRTSDGVYMYHTITPSSDIPASASVTMATGPTSKYRLQSAADAVSPAVSAVKQHLIEMESRASHVQASESSWTQSEPAFSWMKKQTSAVTPTGMHARSYILCRR